MSGDIFGPGGEGLTHEATEQDSGVEQSTCKCIPCLTRLGLSIGFLCLFFRQNRDTLPRLAEASGQDISDVQFRKAAFARTHKSGLFKRRQESPQGLGEDELRMSSGYLNAVMQYSVCIMGDLQGMYIFTTTTGRFGCSPKRPSAGAIVAAVPGGELLHVFSQDKERYVGAASVHGFVGDSFNELVQEFRDRLERWTLH